MSAPTRSIVMAVDDASPRNAIPTSSRRGSRVAIPNAIRSYSTGTLGKTRELREHGPSLALREVLKFIHARAGQILGRLVAIGRNAHSPKRPASVTRTRSPFSRATGASKRPEKSRFTVAKSVGKPARQTWPACTSRKNRTCVARLPLGTESDVSHWERTACSDPARGHGALAADHFSPLRFGGLFALSDRRNARAGNVERRHERSR